MEPAPRSDCDLHRRILESQSTPLLLVDGTLRIRYLNPAAEDLFAASARRLREQPLTALAPASDLEEVVRRALHERTPLTQRELPLPLHGGERLLCDVTVTPLDEGTAIVELARRDHILRADRDARLLEQQAVLDKLLRGLAHEVKNPLGGLRGAAQLLEAELPSPELREYTQVIIREADRLQDLVDHILGPRGGMERRPVNIHEVLEHVRTLVSLETPPGVRLERDYDPSLPEPVADRDHLVQALLNVVQNAVQAVGESGRIRLRTRAERHIALGGRIHRLALRIDVEDDGPGVPEAIRDEIFFPMVTGRAEGSGLGLSIAQSVINRHGGLIQFDSRPGRTVFSIFLPLDGETHEAEEAAGSAHAHG